MYHTRLFRPLSKYSECPKSTDFCVLIVTVCTVHCKRHTYMNEKYCLHVLNLWSNADANDCFFAPLQCVGWCLASSGFLRAAAFGSSPTFWRKKLSFLSYFVSCLLIPKRRRHPPNCSLALWWLCSLWGWFGSVSRTHPTEKLELGRLLH